MFEVFAKNKTIFPLPLGWGLGLTPDRTLIVRQDYSETDFPRWARHAVPLHQYSRSILMH